MPGSGFEGHVETIIPRLRLSYEVQTFICGIPLIANDQQYDTQCRLVWIEAVVNVLSRG